MLACLRAIRHTSQQSLYYVDAADVAVAHPHPVTASGPSPMSRPRYQRRPNWFTLAHTKLH